MPTDNDRIVSKDATLPSAACIDTAMLRQRFCSSHGTGEPSTGGTKVFFAIWKSPSGIPGKFDKLFVNPWLLSGGVKAPAPTGMYCPVIGTVVKLKMKTSAFRGPQAQVG